jgi:hypothetical protein
MPQSEASPDRRYIAVLCLVALLILVAGVWLRPSRTPPPVPSELETLNVQLAMQRLDLQRRSLFYSKKVEELLPALAQARANPERMNFRLPDPGETVILVSNDMNRQPAWILAQTAGALEAPCGDMMAREIATSISIPATLSNAVAFDLDNNLAGIVLFCGDRRILTTPETFKAWNAERALDAKLRECCGLNVAADLEVLGVEAESLLAAAGLRAGDIIMDVAEQPIKNRTELHSALSATPPPTELTVRRGERNRKLVVRR